MRTYIIRRLIVVPPMLVVMSFILFILLFIRPGNASLAVVGGFNDAESAAAFEKELGLDRPWFVQYLDWLGNAVTGDFGKSLKPPRTDVMDLISERIFTTVEIALLTIFMSALIGITVGMISAVKRNTWLDYVLRVTTIAGISVPNFWVATLLLVLPAIWWGWTPLSQNFTTFTENPIKNLSILFWPALVLSISSSAYVARIVRSSMLENLYSDHVRTARAKGLHERVVVIRHVFRSSLVTLITVLGLQFGTILGGSLIAEQIFAIPGLGLLTYEAVLTSDYILVLGAMMLFATVFLLMTLAVDILYTVVDPRIRY
jgi:peptide/nickel transport system permease protein